MSQSHPGFDIPRTTEPPKPRGSGLRRSFIRALRRNDVR